MEPESIGPYEVLKALGSGGEVYLALDGEGRTVAVRQLPAQAPDLERLEREVAAMRQVRSPNVAEIMDADLPGPAPYIVTRYVQGRSLERVVQDRGPLPADAVRRLAAGLARGLEAIHQAGMVHGDLTPRTVVMAAGEPVMVGLPGSGERPEPAADTSAWGAIVVFAATGRRCSAEDPDLDGVPPDLAGDVRVALAGGAAPAAQPWVPPSAAGPAGAGRYEPVRETFRAALGQRDFGRAQTAAGELYRQAAAEGDQEQLAWALRCLGEAMAGRGDHAGAWTNFEQGRSLAVATGRRDIEAACLHGLGLCATAYGDHARADQAHRMAGAIAVEIGNTAIESAGAYELAVAAEQRRDFPQAEWLYERVRQIAVAESVREDQAHALYGLATCAAERGDTPRAGALISEALGIAYELGDREMQGWLREELSALGRGR